MLNVCWFDKPLALVSPQKVATLIAHNHLRRLDFEAFYLSLFGRHFWQNYVSRIRVHLCC
jgi:hypothetical protein